MKRIFPLLFLLSILAIAGTTFAQDGAFKIVGHPGSTPTSISKRDFSRLFLKKTKKWPNGQTAVPVDQKNNDELISAFDEEILGKSTRSIKSYWQAQVFSGKGAPPKQMTSDEAVIQFVRSQPGAVGYVSAEVDSTGLTVIEVFED